MTVGCETTDNDRLQATDVVGDRIWDNMKLRGLSWGNIRVILVLCEGYVGVISG